MNHDPIRFCFECKQMRQAKEFRPLSREPGKLRWVCAGCFTKLEAIRRERHDQGGEPPVAASRNDNLKSQS